MFLKKSVLAAGIVAALAVPTSFAASNANFGQVISSIQASKTGATQIQGITEVKSVNVVKVNDLAKGQNMTALDNAVTKNEADIASLRTALTANAAVNTALTNASVDVAAVVAADVGNDGVLTVYTR
jgi:hypothetical protein